MEKLSKLIERLLYRSERGLIDWQPTADDDTFQFSLADSSIMIFYFSDRNKYILSVLNKFGQTVEKVSDREIDEQIALPETYYHKMERLFTLARRKALKTEQTLDGILAELGE